MDRYLHANTRAHAAMHICSRHTPLALREMSQCREDVYLEGTELMA